MPELQTNNDLVPKARIEDKTFIASVKGEIDLQNSPSLRGVFFDVISRYQPTKIILNLSLVPYMDSSAIAVLVETLQKIRKGGGRMFLTNLQPRVKGLIEIARLNSFFILAKDEEEALLRSSAAALFGL